MGAFLSVGLKEEEWSLLNSELSSGDYLVSGNARPIPQARIGFLGFQNIPFTRGWLQIYGVIAYGKFTDGKWLENHFNRNSRITTGALYHYKCLYLRTKPAKPFSFAIGLQAAMQYKGTEQYYSKGVLTKTIEQPFCVKDIWKMLIPSLGYSREEYYEGNSLGCWDIVLRYRFRNGDEIQGVYESPWEDGSGIAKLNGFDGIWGLEYKCAKKILRCKALWWNILILPTSRVRYIGIPIFHRVRERRLLHIHPVVITIIIMGIITAGQIMV